MSVKIESIREEALAKLQGVTDFAQAKQILVDLGVDDRTAGEIASRHCGTFRGDKVDLAAQG